MSVCRLVEHQIITLNAVATTLFRRRGREAVVQVLEEGLGLERVGRCGSGQVCSGGTGGSGGEGVRGIQRVRRWNTNRILRANAAVEHWQGSLDSMSLSK